MDRVCLFVRVFVMYSWIVIVLCANASNKASDKRQEKTQHKCHCFVDCIFHFSNFVCALPYLLFLKKKKFNEIIISAMSVWIELCFLFLIVCKCCHVDTRSPNGNVSLFFINKVFATTNESGARA